MIYLVRHGETIWNLEGRRQGHGDSPLTTLGIDQAEAIGKRLLLELRNSGAVRIICSPLERAKTTASIIAKHIRMEENDLFIEPLLIEQNVGCWEGLTNNQIDEIYPRARKCRRRNRWDYIIRGGESYEAVYERSVAWLTSLPEDCTVVAVAHEIISRMIRGAYCQLAPSNTFELRHPHNVLYRLNRGTVEEKICG